MTELGEILELLHGTPRWTTLRMEGRQWRHLERHTAAFETSVRTATARTSTTMMRFESATAREAVELPETSEGRWRVWDSPPEWFRADFDVGDQTVTVVFDGPTWWSRSPAQGGQTNGGRPSSRHGRGPGGTLVRPADLLPALHLVVDGEGECCGRTTRRLLAIPRDKILVTRITLSELGLGADEYVLDVDAERGAVLRCEARLAGLPFLIVEAADVAFDEPLPDDTFRLEPPDGEGFHLPALPRSVDLEDLDNEVDFTVWLVDAWHGRGPQVTVRPLGRGRDAPEVVYAAYIPTNVDDPVGQFFLIESSRSLEMIPDDAVMVDGITVHEVTNGEQRRVRAFLQFGETHIQVDSPHLDVSEVVAIAKRLVPSADFRPSA